MVVLKDIVSTGWSLIRWSEKEWSLIMVVLKGMDSHFGGLSFWWSLISVLLKRVV